MIFKKTPLTDAMLITLDQYSDSRGHFARFWSQREFSENGINFTPTESNLSYNRVAHTLRGMHFQSEPHAQAKLVLCTRGRIFDAIVDIRPNSQTYCKWFTVELAHEERNCLYIPRGFAHGFLTLEDHSEVLYFMSGDYYPSAASGFRWDDPEFNIVWPFAPQQIHERDRAYPNFNTRRLKT